jgi:hypothetical protein
VSGETESDLSERPAHNLAYLVDADGNFKSSPPPSAQPTLQRVDSLTTAESSDAAISDTPPSISDTTLAPSAIQHSTEPSNRRTRSKGGKAKAQPTRTTQSRNRKENIPHGAKPQPAKPAKVAPLPSRTRGRKRPLQEIADGDDEVVLNDGRRGVFKRVK